ncbi:hypothetical protein SK128_017333 [Halocaridina rubra]|uniref:Uncharacterized protein n=1 Tax=Halocaridina rubra TaxID=373956 RepID=A0AAN9A8T3_HALRR
MSDQATKIVISDRLRECNSITKKIFCDFQNSGIRDVYIEPSDPRNVNDKVYVHNVENVHLVGPLCQDLALKNVANILLEEQGDYQCEDGYELAAKKASLESIPKNADKIYLDQCNISSLATENSLKLLTLLHSDIKEFNISAPFRNNSILNLKDSNIEILQKLIIEEGAAVAINSLKISHLASNGLLLKHVNITIRDSTFLNITKDSVITHEQSKISWVNFTGEYPLTGAEIKGSLNHCPMFLIICISLGLLFIVFLCCGIFGKWSNKCKSSQGTPTDQSVDGWILLEKAPNEGQDMKIHQNK